MRQLLCIGLATILTLGWLFSGCQDAENISGKGHLSFSTDTLSFDTLFSTIGSTTAWLKVYNRESHAVTIDQVRLKSGGQSGFRISLDGESQLPLSNVTIPAHDSLFLFVELTAPLQNSTLPQFLGDAVLFETAEGLQQIVLEAWSWDATIWHGKAITADTTLTGDKPIILYDSLVIAPDVTLTLDEGTTLFIHDRGKVLVYGNVKAKGSVAHPVTFRGDRLDNEFDDYPYDYNAGQWYYIQLKKNSFNNEFDHVRIRGGYYGIIADSSSADQLKLTLTNSVVTNAYYYSLYSFCNRLLVINSELSNSGSYTVFLIGGEATFIHCTIANYEDFKTREEPSVVLANYLLDSQKNEIPYPLKAHFTNCLIFGNQSEELALALSANESVGADLFFQNCLLRTQLKLGMLADQCLYPSEVGFLKTGSAKDKWVYDYRIDSTSVARGAASMVEANQYPFDLNGKNRLADGKPDIGAYEY
ncbi:MAG: hypothetical protein Q8914_10145 [Bacteroidota bacterium]|nr:hypothetical protein [Bacteroidota bacterium]